MEDEMGLQQQEAEANPTMEQIATARFISCVQANRKQKLEVLKVLREKEQEISELGTKNTQLANELHHLRSVHESVTAQSKFELLEIQKELSNAEFLMKNGKCMQDKNLVSEETLKNQKEFYVGQLQQRDVEIGKLEAGVQQLQMKLNEAVQDRLLAQEKVFLCHKEKHQLKLSGEETVSRLTREKEELNNQYKQLAAKYAEQDESMQDYCQQLNKMQIELKINKEASFMNPSIQAQLLDRQKREAQLVAQLQELEKINKSAENSQILLLKENAELKKLVENLEERLKKTEELNTELQNKLLEVERVTLDKIGTLAKEFSAKKAEHEKEIQQLAAESARVKDGFAKELKQRVAVAEKLQFECKFKTQKCLEFKGVSEQMKKLAQEAHKDGLEHKKISDTLRAEVETLRKDLATCRTQYETMKVKQSKLNAEFAKVRESEATCSEILSQLCEAVSEKLEMINGEYQRASAVAESSTGTDENTQIELQKALDQLAENQKDNEQKKRENKELHQKLLILEKDNQILNEKVTELVSSETDQLQNLSSLEDLVREKSAALAAKEEELKMMESNQQHELEFASASLEKKNWQLTRKCGVLEDDIKKLREEEERMRLKLLELHKDNANLQQCIQQLMTFLKSKSSGHGCDASSGDVIDENLPNFTEFCEMLEKLIEVKDGEIRAKDEIIDQLNQHIGQLQSTMAALEKKSAVHEKASERAQQKEKGEKRLMEEKVKVMEAERDRLQVQLEEMKTDRLNLVQALNESNLKISEVEDESFRHFSVYEETEKKLEASLERIKFQQSEIKNLKKDKDNLNQKLCNEKIDAEEEIAECRRTINKHKEALRKITNKQNQPKKIVESEKSEKKSPLESDFPNQSLLIVDYLIDNLEGKTNLDCIKMCKTIRKDLLKDKSAIDLVSLITRDKTPKK